MIADLHAGTATFLIGDTFDRMAELPDDSVDLVLTSPPFLALRSYLPADHPDKDKEIGSEPTPADFLDTLLALTAEWGRVLAPHGSIAIELGDTYAGSGGAGGDYNTAGLREGQERFSGSAAANRGIERSESYDGGASDHHDFAKPGTRSRMAAGHGWPLDKSLCIIPELYAASLAYGRNILTGAESPAGQWRVRNLVRWVRPNPPVGALGDKYRPATSVMVVATRARDRWFDLDAVRGEPKHPHVRHTAGDKNERSKDNRYRGETPNNPAGAPPLDWWEIPTHPYKGAHYATWPPALCERPILSMCPRDVCESCGEPRRRIVGEAEYEALRQPFTSDQSWGDERVGMSGSKAPAARHAPTLGWTVCDCPAPTYRPGIVLDPFAGSGTTLAVATGHSRAAIGIDLDQRNANLALERVGPMLLTIHNRPDDR